MSYNDTPLTPTQRTLREHLGQHGDFDNNSAHDKLTKIKTQQDNIATETSQIAGAVGFSSSYATGTVWGDLALINSNLSSTDAKVTTIQNDVEDSTSGLVAIKNAIDTVSNDIASVQTTVTQNNTDIAAVQTTVSANQADLASILTRIGDPTATQGSLSAENQAILSVVSNIQNNTRTSVALLEEMEIPSAGDVLYRISLKNYALNGGMAIPTTAPTITATTFSGTDVSTKLVTSTGGSLPNGNEMINNGVGSYEAYFKVSSTDTPNVGIEFEITITDDDGTRTISRVSRIVEEISSTFTAADRVVLNDTNTNVHSLTDTTIPALQSDVSSIDTKVDTIITTTTNIEADTQDIQNTLISIQNKDSNNTFDSSTDSLEAISDKIDSITVSSLPIPAFRAIGATGSLASGGSETVTLLTGNGVTAENLKIVTLKVTPVIPANATSFTVEVFEDASLNHSFYKWTGAKGNKGDLYVIVNANFYNQDSPAQKAIYVKVTADTLTANTAFNIEVRGDVLSL